MSSQKDEVEMNDDKCLEFQSHYVNWHDQYFQLSITDDNDRIHIPNSKNHLV